MLLWRVRLSIYSGALNVCVVRKGLCDGVARETGAAVTQHREGWAASRATRGPKLGCSSGGRVGRLARRGVRVAVVGWPLVDGAEHRRSATTQGQGQGEPAGERAREGVQSSEGEHHGGERWDAGAERWTRRGPGCLARKGG